MKCLVFALCVAFTVLAEDEFFHGYQVYRLVPANKQQIKVLVTLKKDGRFDFWTSPRAARKAVDVMVKPEYNESFLREVNAANISCEILINSLTKVADQEWRSQVLVPDHEERISFTQYNSHEKINAYLDELAEAHPDVAFVEKIGKSYEGRDMKVIKISADANTTKPIIFIDAGIHAREWAAPAVAIHIIYQLVENTENAALLERVDWHVLPVVNPDGYEYSQAEVKHIMWRKTRSKGDKCNGVDGNRNFGFHWGEIGAGDDECADNYRGPKAFSEPETQAVRDHILKYKSQVKLYLSFHGFGGYILYPWGYTAELPKNHKELHDLGVAVAKAIASVNGTEFTVGSEIDVMYASAGSSLDWIKGVAGIDLCYGLEVRGEGVIGFFPTGEHISSIVTEIWAGIKTFHEYIQEKFAENP